MSDDDRIALLTTEVANLRIRVADLERIVVGHVSTVPPPSKPEPDGAGFAPPTMLRVRAPRGR